MHDPMVRRIEDSSLAERVTAELRRAIICGSLAPGQEFSLREIAGMLGVSFIPVREALRGLESEGLVTTRRGRSAMVTPLNSHDLAAVYRLRRVIEPELAERSCLMVSDAELDALEGSVHSFGDEQLGIDEVYEAHHDSTYGSSRPPRPSGTSASSTPSGAPPNATSASASASSTRNPPSIPVVNTPTKNC